MIPILFEKNETSFTSNGLGRLRSCISCQVTEERNSIFECNFDYPIDGENYEDILLGRVIGVTHDDTGEIQPFDIVSSTKPINGIVSFHAVHISYRLAGYSVAGSNINSLSAALNMLTSSEPAMPFTFETDFSASGYMAAADGLPKTARQLLGGVEGSILDTYGGEFLWDRFRVLLKKNRGEVRDFNIRYGLNMTDYEDETDYSGVYNQCKPFWTDGQNTIIGGVVSSGFSGYAGRDICMPLDLSDKFETQPTKAELEAKALQYMQNNQTHLPRQNIKVDFVRLQDTGEYEQFENLLQCNLCDSIGVIFPRYGMQGTFKIVRVVYDVLAERYKEMELGALSVSLSEALGIQNGQSQGLSASNPEDYIVEEGTSGIWTYRKWNSGIAECWGNVSGSASFTRTWGGLYICDAFTVSFPSGLFIANPVATMSAQGGNSLIVFNGGTLNAASMKIQAGRGSSTSNYDYFIGIHVKGRWKS